MPFPSPGDLPDLGIEPWSLTLLVDSLPFEPPGKPLAPGSPDLNEDVLFWQTVPTYKISPGNKQEIISLAFGGPVQLVLVISWKY